jgi:hypothetical protein
LPVLHTVHCNGASPNTAVLATQSAILAELTGQNLHIGGYEIEYGS